MDVLTISWGWYGGYPVSGPTPPPTPPTPSTGDGVALPGTLLSFGAGVRRFYWRDRADPWAAIMAWLRRLTGRGQDAEWQEPGILKPDPEQQARAAFDATVATRISRITRRKR